MSHNQTIDGVSRKSLEQALKLAAVFDDGGDGADAESARGVVWILRALLDAPAVLGEIDLTPKRLAHAEIVIEQQNNLIASLRAELVESYRVAAQPQGEPVAVDALSTGFYTTESGGGKYAISIGFRSMADMQAADAQLRDLLKSR